MIKYRLPLIFLVMIMNLGRSPTREDYSALTTWEYINESSYPLKIEGGEDVLDFNLAKEAGHSFEIKYRTEKDISEATFTSPYDSAATKIIIAGERIVTASNITDRENYIAEKIAERHYKFTYIFTDADFAEE